MVQWGLRHKVHPAVLGFIRYRPDLLFHQENENLERGWPTPRSWERVSSMLLSFDKTDSVLCNKVISGLVGCQVGVEFCAFLTISEEFDNVYELMTNPSKKISVPEKCDQKFAFCAAVVYHLWRGTSLEMEEKLLSVFYRIAMKLPGDFSTMMMMDAMSGNQETVSQVFSDKLFSHPKYQEWAELHGKAMRARMNRSIVLE